MLELRRMRAETLEKLGKVDEAIGEWLRYEHYDSKSPLAASIHEAADGREKQVKAWLRKGVRNQ